MWRKHGKLKGLCGKTKENIGKSGENVGKHVGKNMETFEKNVGKHGGTQETMGTQWISWGTGGFNPKSLQIQDGKWRESIGFWGTIFSVKTTAIPIIARQDFRAPGAQGHTPSPISQFHGWYKPSPSARFMVLGWLHCSSSVPVVPRKAVAEVSKIGNL